MAHPAPAPTSTSTSTSPPSPPQPTLLPPPGPSILHYRLLPTPTLTLSPPPTPTSPPPPLISALTIRHSVFVLEQHCDPALEIDDHDAVAWHWVMYAEDGEKEGDGVLVPAATVRVVLAGEGGEGDGVVGSRVWDGKEGFARMGRVATMRGFRGRGFGGMLVGGAVGFVEERVREREREMEEGGEGEGKGALVLVHAQVGVRGWYEGLGFVVDEGMGRWVEEGIEHVGMWWRGKGGKGKGEGEGERER